MQIQFKLSTPLQGLKRLGKQANYALALTINRTLDEAQVAVRTGIRSRFTIRGRAAGFVDRLVKRRREDFANKRNLLGRLRIEGPEGDLARAKILTRHQEGGERTTNGIGGTIDPVARIGNFFFIPTDHIRFPFSATVPRKFFPAYLGLQPMRSIAGGSTIKSHTTRSGKVQLKGKQRTFVLFSPNGRPWGIYQRGEGTKGKTRGYDIRLIWRFDKRITLKPRLQFYETARSVFQDRAAANFSTQFAMALRTAK
jgi:hypothetical protein